MAGFVLLKSLLAMAVLLLCMAWVLAAVAATVKHGSLLQTAAEKELEYRNEE
jgi:hypothetical protein